MLHFASGIPIVLYSQNMTTNFIDKLNLVAEEINNKYKKTKPNIMYLLKNGESENKHSDMINSLLKTPSLASDFLMIVKSKLKDGILNSIHYKSSCREKPIEIEGEKGKIDIEITLENNQRIIIENKIHAQDRFNQMNKYICYYESEMNNECTPTIYCYLTINGETPSQYSLPDNMKRRIQDRFVLLSYKEDIYTWLTNWCNKTNSCDDEYVWSAAKQYLGTISNLIHNDGKYAVIRSQLDVFLHATTQDLECIDTSETIPLCKEAILQATQTISKLNCLNEIKYILADKMKKNILLKSYAECLRFTINQRVMFESFKDFKKMALVSLHDKSCFGVVCCMDREFHRICGIGYEFERESINFGMMMGGTKQHFEKYHQISLSKKERKNEWWYPGQSLSSKKYGMPEEAANRMYAELEKYIKGI